MASLSFVVALSGVTGPVQVSASVPTGGLSNAYEKGAWSFVSIQALGANTGVVYGAGAHPGASMSSTGAYGFRIEIPASTVPPAPTVFELSRGNIDLSELWLAGGSGDKVTVHCIG